MNKIKEFIKKNKTIIINVACVVVGGLVVYSLTRDGKTSKDDISIAGVVSREDDDFKPDFVISKSIVNAIKKSPDYNFKTFDEAADNFKEHQGVNNSVAMFFEDNNYQVFPLEQK